jgi:hypothetical protein
MKTFKRKTARVNSETGLAIRQSSLPSFHVSGSLTDMRELYWGNNCKPVRVGQFIYNCERKPKLYDDAT